MKKRKRKWRHFTLERFPPVGCGPTPSSVRYTTEAPGSRKPRFPPPPTTFALLAFGGVSSTEAVQFIPPQTKKGKNVSGEKEKGEVIGLNKRDEGERLRVSPFKTRAPTGFFLFFSFFLDAGVVIVEAERKDRECPCVSAASYATTGYRRLASRPRPLL